MLPFLFRPVYNVSRDTDFTADLFPGPRQAAHPVGGFSFPLSLFESLAFTTLGPVSSLSGRCHQVRKT